MALVNIKGTPAIVWGTGGVANIPNGAVVESLSLTPKNGEPIEIEDGFGLGINQVILRDGFNAKMTVMYDASKTFPVEGANAALTIPYAGANANSIPFGESNGANYAANAVTYVCLVAAPPQPTFSKKKELMIEFNLTYRPQIAV